MANLMKTLSLAAAALTLATAAQAGTVYVANNGLDGVNCGMSSAQPCRTMTEGIEKASAGDTVEVGPGIYGDIDGDGEYTTPGDEPFDVEDYERPYLIGIDKGITVVSRDGAGETAIRLGLKDPFDSAPHYPASVVNISADGVVFGQPDKGFTVVGTANTPAVDNALIGIALGRETRDIEIAGNTVAGFDQGMFIVGTDHYVAHNTAGPNETGIQLEGAGHRVTRNVVHANVTGISMEFAEKFEITYNTIVGNDYRGILLDGSDHEITRNNILGNGETGIHIFGTAAIHENNIYGNGEADIFPGFANCGVMLWDTNLKLSATNNYWGASTGPGANPADRICPPGERLPILVEPFATAPFAERVRGGRFLK